MNHNKILLNWTVHWRHCPVVETGKSPQTLMNTTPNVIFQCKGLKNQMAPAFKGNLSGHLPLYVNRVCCSKYTLNKKTDSEPSSKWYSTVTRAVTILSADSIPCPLILISRLGRFLCVINLKIRGHVTASPPLLQKYAIHKLFQRTPSKSGVLNLFDLYALYTIQMPIR